MSDPRTEDAAGAGPASFSQPDADVTNVFYGGQNDGAGSGSFSDSESLPALEGDETAGGDSFTETTSVSWIDKLMEAIVGVGFGLFLVLAMTVILFWNEGRAVTTYRSLNEGAGLVVNVESGRLDPANEGKLVHVQGDLSAATPAADPMLAMQANAARLVRKVEMYQWKEESHTETHKRVGGGEDRTTTYSYTHVWSDSRNASERFRNQSGHQNPQMRFTRQETTAADARIGAFRPGAQALGRIPADRAEPVTDEVVARLRQRSGTGTVQVADGTLYFGMDPLNPRVGDHRVTYESAPLGPTTFIGRQTGADLQEYQTRAGDRLLMAKGGLVPADAMFAQAQADNRLFTWIMRLLGVIFMWAGFLFILRPIAVVGDIVPIVGTILGIGAGLAAFAMTAVLAPVVMAIAWLFYRPLIAIGLLLAGAAIAYGLHWLAAKRREGRVAGVPAGMTARPA